MSGSLFGSLDVVVGAEAILVVEVDIESLVVELAKDVAVLELLVVNPGVVSWLVAAEVAVVSSVWVIWPSVVVPVGVPSVSGLCCWGGFLAGGGRSGCCLFGLGGLALGRCPRGCAISEWPLLLGWFPGWWRPKWLLSLRSGWFGPRSLSPWVCHQ